jgi:lytic murein transglycosylase
MTLVAKLAAQLALAATLIASAGPAIAVDRAAVERQFSQWLDAEIRPEALARGVTARNFDQALGSVRISWELPDLVPPGTKPRTPEEQFQAEFRSPAAYFAGRHLDAVIAGGRLRLNRHAQLLAKLERETGVPGPILLAIWGRESGFGAAKPTHNAFVVLATKAFMSSRKEMFRKELLAALEMVAWRRVPITAMKSSWAGALGQPQFLPTSYLAHARDGDGDGKIDIWNSDADTLASIANYLRYFGWVRGRDWGFEVVVPDSVDCFLEGPDRGRTIAEWAAMGVARASGKPFPASELAAEGYLMMPAGRFGPAFIVTPNFYVLKDYNESDLYALFIGHAGDRIAFGGTGFSAGWRGIDAMKRSDIAEIQQRLETIGNDVGGVDGLPGFKTRRSIGQWQKSQGQAPSCFPSQTVHKSLG